MGNYAEKLKGAVVEEVCTATKVQEVSKPDDHLIQLGVTKLSSSAGFEQPQNDLAMELPVREERREMENQLEKVHGNEYQGTRFETNINPTDKLQSKADKNSLHHLNTDHQVVIVAASKPTTYDVQGNLNTAHMREQALVGEQLLMQKHSEQVHGNDEGTQATSSEASKEKLQSMADNNSLEHLYVELRGVENFGPTEHGIVEVNSPTVAGNLSPRPGVPQENLPESSGPSSSIDQSGGADRNPKQKRTKGFSGPNFTWSNNRRSRARISKRLDRFLVNGACLDLSYNISVLHLARHPSDHSPLKLSFVAQSDTKPRPFRFLNVWTTKPQLLEVIRQAWTQDVNGSPMRALCSKLLATRKAIQTWNKEHFGNVIDNVRSAEMAVQRAEEVVDQDDSEECQIELKKAQAELRYALSIEEQFWRQKARVKWLRQGDTNSKYFHAIVRQRRAQAMIHRIKKANGVWVDNEADIASEATTYFSELFSDSLGSSADMLQLIPPMISGEDNVKLEEIPSIEEVFRVLKAMDEESAAGPDGFTGKFFTFAWQVIAQDVYKAVLSFFCGAELPRFITSTSIVLIPKVPNPQDFSQFRPISLCNFFNKLLSRILADRVAGILPKIISPQQTGFVKGRNITENFLLAQEVISGMAKKNRGGNVVMKLDMSKAYDRVAWSHIINVLRRFGFGERFIDMVWRMISNVWFSVIINGSSYGFFKSSRGLRQGDPLSPALFIIGAEVLSRALNNLVMQPRFVSFKVPYGCPSITHLAFADDVLIFANGSSFSLKAIMKVLDDYQRCSGQLLNVQKSCYLVHPSVSMARRRLLDRISRFARKSFPIRYLGFPLYIGRCKSSYFGEVCHAILARILSWKSRLLSFGGKIILIKHVLSSIPVHLMSAAMIPSSVFKTIEKACSAFLWGSSPEESKLHWIRWPQLCYPVEEGGIGFRRLCDVYTSFSSKLWWKFRTESSLWSTFMKAKYCKYLHPCQVELRPTDSAIWRRMLNVSRQVELSILWVAKYGACHFWYDNWLGSGALFLKVPVIPNLTFRNFVNNGHWDLNLLYHTLPKEIAYSISEQMVPEEGSIAEVFWMPTTTGNFSLHSAFGDIRQTRPTSMVFASIWHSLIPLKVSFFMLRLLLRRIPTPDKLRKFGFHLLSKCFCCTEPSEESIEHLFSNGHIASFLWNYFGGLCGIKFSGSFLRARIVDWWLNSQDSELRKIICRILPSVICWQIWKARNKALFEGVQMQSSAIRQAIFSEIQSMVGIHFKQLIRLQSFCQLYDWSKAPGGTVVYQGIRWETKETGRYTLNTDGCAKGNPGIGGGGGILRDSTGLPMIGFSAYLGETTCLRAEACALLIGLQICIHNGFGNICVQSDSLVLIGIIQRRTQCPWKIRRYVNQIWQLLDDPPRFTHCYREANTVADALSNVGISHPDKQIEVYDTFSKFPRLARGAIRLDRIGIPSIRKMRIM
ncbi:uncharacterized protein [Coffea arabica]|uniref:Reverse transcriptase domain-containing protein n=1 Tax=Coffea arabica TaxID=13443 RepID=A0ABM4W8A3_COFAR